MFYQLSGQSLAQSRCHLKLTITVVQPGPNQGLTLNGRVCSTTSVFCCGPSSATCYSGGLLSLPLQQLYLLIITFLTPSPLCLLMYYNLAVSVVFPTPTVRNMKSLCPEDDKQKMLQLSTDIHPSRKGGWKCVYEAGG